MGARQFLMQGALKTARAASGADGEDLRFIRPAAKTPERAQSPEATVRKGGVGKGLFKFIGEQSREFGIFHFHHQVEPTLQDSVAAVAVANVGAAEEGGLAVADEQLAVVAHAKAGEAQGIEETDYAAGPDQRFKKVFGQHERTIRIGEHANLDAAFGGLRQGIEKLPADFIVGVDVNLQLDALPRPPDGVEHGRKKFPAAAKPLWRFWRDCGHGVF